MTLQAKATILLAGIGGQCLHPEYMEDLSADIAKGVATKGIDGFNVIPLELPCREEFPYYHGLINAKMEEYDPVGVFLLGTFHGADKIRMERFAVNNFEVYRPIQTFTEFKKGVEASPLISDGKRYYRSEFPLKEVCEQLPSHPIPVVTSESITHQVCNVVYYTATYVNLKRRNRADVTFVHTCYTPEQAQLRFDHEPGRGLMSSFPLVEQVDRVTEIVRTWAEVKGY
jgi:pyrrolidone-carboxylate peptidase